mmetsp:Transcript_69690/g.209214  ORF Transcript_69690/g.209214 Transcript_69690/m.209214 type:complete len:201 (-) Transcript_69690:321-923(-)
MDTRRTDTHCTRGTGTRCEEAVSPPQTPPYATHLTPHLPAPPSSCLESRRRGRRRYRRRRQTHRPAPPCRWRPTARRCSSWRQPSPPFHPTASRPRRCSPRAPHRAPCSTQSARQGRAWPPAPRRRRARRQIGRCAGQAPRSTRWRPRPHAHSRRTHWRGSPVGGPRARGCAGGARFPETDPRSPRRRAPRTSRRRCRRA